MTSAAKHGLRRCGRVNAIGLDGNNEIAAVLKKLVSVDGNNTRLVGLSNVGKDDVDHTDKHAILVWVTGVLDDRNDVCALLGNVDQVTAGPVRKLHRVDESLRADDVGHVGDGRSGGSTEVKNLLARCDVDLIDTAKDGRSQLGAEGIPYTVFNLLAVFLKRRR